jgi:hypothetical protein
MKNASDINVHVHGFNPHGSREAILNQIITHKFKIYPSSVTGQKIISSKWTIPENTLQRKIN